MKGIILAGGSGTRLRPITLGTSKQLLPVYDKPMIYYPISTLLLAGISEILLITTPEDRAGFERVLGNGSQWGINLQFATQSQPRGLAEAFIIGREFVGSGTVCLVLGDNLFYGEGLGSMLERSATLKAGALIFGYSVKNPSQYGVVEVGPQGQVLSLEEKPARPKSNFAIPGLYFYDNQVLDFAKNLKPSPRGELEITDINRIYFETQQLRMELLGRGTAWLDTGTPDTLLQAGTFIQTVETRQGLKIGCPEEISYHKGLISADQVRNLARNMGSTDYSQYLLDLLER